MEDKVVDKYGNKKCLTCGSVYGRECWQCCTHGKIKLYDDHDNGIMIECVTCGKDDFTVREFNENYQTIRIMKASYKRLLYEELMCKVKTKLMQAIEDINNENNV